jgi:cystathionine beta-lyase/cystathionine gamma-synthase
LKALQFYKNFGQKKKGEYIQSRKYFRFNKDEHIVRLHIGLEDPKDLINDLKNSLRYIK